jgi:ubiquinone/menaquinone biosynthesis C-methylase UbiE
VGTSGRELTIQPGPVIATFAEAFLAACNSADQPRERTLVLDVGNGRGRIPIEICARQSGIEIVAVDCEPTILEAAQRNIQRSGFASSIHLHQADAGALPYADAVFDAVISNSLLHHLPDPVIALREFRRVVRVGGLLFLRDTLRTQDADRIEQILSRRVLSGHAAAARHRFAGLLTIDQARNLAREVGLPADWASRQDRRHWILSGRMSEVPPS